MIKLNNFAFKTSKSTPKVSDNKSTWILLQAGFIRQTMAWVYSYTTLWLKVYNKIENIVRKEMDSIWAFETKLPNISPKELWDKTNRWWIDVLFHVPAANNKEYALNSTHEEIITPLMWDFIQSYKDLPVCAYQIQYKFRNEKRAKSWILRWREFIMKDAYSFHSSDEEFKEYYEKMKVAYMNIFKELWLWKDTFIALADWWVFTDKYSHEFQVKLDIWEDVVYYDKKSWISYNQEIAPSLVPDLNTKEDFKEKKDILWEWIIWVEALENHLWITAKQSTKTLIFTTEDNKIVIASVRWDYEINTLKLQKIIWCKELTLADNDTVKQITWADIWYAWLIGLNKIIKDNKINLYIDDSVKWLCNFETGTNKTWYHSINVNFWRDVDLPEKFYDFKDAKKWDKNPETWEVYEVFNASEIWNIFPLETKFSKAFNVKYLDKNNKEQTPLMWCYGIWVTRAMWIIAEYYVWNKWINWPENLAPADYYIIVIWEENLQKAEELAKQLESEWKEVILDDRMGRKFWFWQKAWDCELFWIPNRIVISPKTLEKWGYELKTRDKKEKIIKI